MAALTHRALNRATLARQGLLAPLELGVADGLRAIGAVQAQQWTAVPVALGSRLAGFEPAALWPALDAGEVVTGIGIRGTLHLVAASEHPAYATTARAGGVGDPGYAWPVHPEADTAIAAAVLAAGAARIGPADAAGIAEAWVAERPEVLDAAALEARRAVKWRPLLRRPDLVRVPAAGAWSAKTPPASMAAPWAAAGAWLEADAALDTAVVAHLRAFGPAAPQDTAAWLGVPPALVRAALQRLDVLDIEGPDGGTLHDLADAPRPDGETPAPPRFLAAFDSLLLAYATGRRDRVMSAAMQAVVYKPGNLRIDASFLVDGLVAGTWVLDVKRKAATITLTPAGKLPKTALRGLEREGDRLLGALAPVSASRVVAVAT